ncbi:rare lipoprotein A [Parasphingorhabdus marina DSM 22363]|uniref:Endolytic peptidoglycan transglycosylase RlpA n=1 Tax=Parasphingorhabdus marina DSM 22363 TaxID=1123272 RepID=A0A1N6FPR5_9SPHN|nr:septal ring lytic transglycosylase RlpA family protein [Parasphingorhabdus marina]SIN97230.1 rare lipoprotein A [Parasphingorhabdus marina DSM 22363]
MKFNLRLLCAVSLTGALAGCGSFDGVNDNMSRGLEPAPAAPAAAASTGISDFPQKIGEPYKVGGKTYTPEDVASYDNVGYASWYGEELAGNPTANGEKFNPNGISAAHKTLPLPSYVEVTALDTGRTILVRVNDRGPFTNDRLIDLSYGAARQLGIDQQGVAGVRVRKVNPNEQERAVLRNGGQVTERIPTPDSLLTILRKNLAKLPQPAAPVRQATRSAAPAGAVNTSGVGASYVPPTGRPTGSSRASGDRFIIENQTGATQSRSTAPAPRAVSTASGFVVQVAAFSSRARANTLANKIGAKVMSDGTGKIWRVRYGPYATERAAEQGLNEARRRGYGGARILRAGK